MGRAGTPTSSPPCSRSTAGRSLPAFPHTSPSPCSHCLPLSAPCHTSSPQPHGVSDFHSRRHDECARPDARRVHLLRSVHLVRRVHLVRSHSVSPRPPRGRPPPSRFARVR